MNGNLKLKVSLPSDGHWWGEETPPGSGNFSGLMGDLQHARVELGWGNLFITMSRKRTVDFTDWYIMVDNCAMVPRPRSYSKILSLYLPLHWTTW